MYKVDLVFNMSIASIHGINSNADFLLENFINDNIMYNTINGYGYSFGTRIENIAYWLDKTPKFLTIVDLKQQSYGYEKCDCEIPFYNDGSVVFRKPNVEDYLNAIRKLNIE